MDSDKLLKLIPAAIWVLLAVLTLWRLSDTGAELSLFTAVIAWALWFVVFVALLVPATVGLTIVFIAIPVVAAIVGLTNNTVDPAILIAGVAIPFVIVWTPAGDYMINGSSYGSEKRFLLKPTVLMSILFPVLTTLSALFAGFLISTAAQNQWVIAAILAIPTIAAVYVAARVIHQGFSRWLVFVPAGVVIHDPYLLKISAMTRKPNASHLTTARADTDGPETTDLTGGATGYRSHLVTREPIPLDFRNGENIESNSITFAPLRPGAVLREARVRGFKTKVSN